MSVWSRAGLRRRNYEETYIVGEWGGSCHDGDHHVLLEVEPPRVEAPSVAEGGKLPGREGCLQKFASGEGEQLDNICRDSNPGLTDAEELIDKSSAKQSISKYTPSPPSVWQGSKDAVIADIPSCNEDSPDEPGTEGTCGHCGVIVVINHGTNLGVRRILATMRFRTWPKERNTHGHQKSSLDLELFIDPLALHRVVPQFLVKTVEHGCFDNARGEDLCRER